MANLEHLKILKKGVEAWNKWREKYPNEEPDLTEINLENTNLENINFSKVDLRNSKLSHARLERSNLEKANLSWTQIDGSSFESANLRNANMRKSRLLSCYLRFANLERAFIEEANLIGSDFKLANLRIVRFYGTKLCAVNFNEANLEGVLFKAADLRDANLISANMRLARMGYTILGNVNLSDTKYLETVKHEGPSTIGIDTIYKSKGNIPEVFLRGCGVPENFIIYMNSLVGRGFEFYSCFISYSHADKAFAQRLHNDLQAKGIRCWLDEHQLLPGDDILDEIDRGIKLWNKIILICSKESLTSWWVEKEIEKAVQKEEQLWKKHEKKILALIPVDLDRYVFDGWESGKASIVKGRYIADCTGWDQDHAKYEKQVRRIVEALKTEDAGRAPVPGEKV